jgi:hypothetical protein
MTTERRSPRHVSASLLRALAPRSRAHGVDPAEARNPTDRPGGQTGGRPRLVVGAIARRSGGGDGSSRRRLGRQPERGKQASHGLGSITVPTIRHRPTQRGTDEDLDREHAADQCGPVSRSRDREPASAPSSSRIGPLPLRCHCDGRSGVLEGARGPSAILKEWVPVTAMRAASDAIFARLQGFGLASPHHTADGPLKAETRVRIPLMG